MGVATGLGLLRSLAIYHGHPIRAAAQQRFLSQFVRPGDLAFDIGAHVGSRSRLLHRLGARVIALEPQPHCAAVIARLLPGVTLLPKAAGRSEGRATLHISRRHPTVSSLSAGWIKDVAQTEGFRHVRWDQRLEVEVTTLDALIAAHGLPAFCKIDVEGHEAEILAGSNHPIPTVALEYLPETPDLARAAVAQLARNGDYAFNFVQGEGHDFIGPWKDADSLLSQLSRQGDIYARLA
ncbi:FkbM family methyltransferase [Cereibacter sp. SYSU M97828]|nr:FkbM family methyltransferase [Cereibacter flavus]